MKLKLKDGMRRYKKINKLGIHLPEICRLLRRDRNQSETVLFNKKIKVNNAFWYLNGLEELFIEETYKFNSSKTMPKIVDCGANIGLSIIYFKRLFPQAKIIAFEPDSKIFKLLQENLHIFGYDDVELVNKAVWNKNGSAKFFASGDVGSRISEDENAKNIEIPTYRLQDLLGEEIDFLKMDIEGAEYNVIEDCKYKLRNVKNIFIEYHSEESTEQKLDEILKILKEAGFRYYIKEAWDNQPFPYVNERDGLFDLQLNIFGYRLEE